MSKILIFSGSTRTESWNTKLAHVIAKAIPAYGDKAQLISLKDYPMPIYHGDLETNEGIPASTIELAQLMSEHDAVIIVSPEYNSAPPPLVKNTLDWLSRLKNVDGTNIVPFKNSVFAIAAATPGSLGGIRSLIMLRTILEVGLGALVIPEQLSVAQVHHAFDENGFLVADRPKALMDTMLISLTEKIRAFKS